MTSHAILAGKSSVDASFGVFLNDEVILIVDDLMSELNCKLIAAFHQSDQQSLIRRTEENCSASAG